jgi:SAM-dependent methyltransferase
MNIRATELAKRLSMLLGADAIRYEGRTLPARHLRLCGDEFRDDGFFLRSAHAEADRLVRHSGLGRDSALLDIGCGVGRLPLGVLDQVGEIRRYCGVDVSRVAISWCNRHIAETHPTFSFLHVDVRNDRYNPAGTDAGSTVALPLEPSTFDIVYAYSVFSHTELQDLDGYMLEFRRLLRPQGRVFVTLFVADDVPDVTVNPRDSERAWTGPLHCVRYRREFIESRLARAGFTVESASIGTETDGQSGYYLRRTGEL